MNILYILIAILMFEFIVIVHELGHYLVGRLCGIGIVEFSVGFGPKILAFKRKDIAYSLRAIPLGGYCSFVGEDEAESSPKAMNKQPVWKRFLTVAAGPLMNFLLAYVFCAILLGSFYYAEALPRISQVVAESPAEKAGVMAGDVITAINGETISYDGAGVASAQSALDAADEVQAVQLTLSRDGQEISLPVLLEPVYDESGSIVDYQIGVYFDGRRYGFFEALGDSAGTMVNYVVAMVDSLKNLIFKGEGTGDVMGPVGIVSFVSTQISRDSLYSIVNLIFFLPLNLGIMNLLPLPALDGGRLVFLAVEGVRRKPIPPEKEGMVHAAGMLLLLAVFIIITYKDVARLITGG